jgi:hypothetical protein
MCSATRVDLLARMGRAIICGMSCRECRRDARPRRRRQEGPSSRRSVRPDISQHDPGGSRGVPARPAGRAGQVQAVSADVRPEGSSLSGSWHGPSVAVRSVAVTATRVRSSCRRHPRPHRRGKFAASTVTSQRLVAPDASFAIVAVCCSARLLRGLLRPEVGEDFAVFVGCLLGERDGPGHRGPGGSRDAIGWPCGRLTSPPLWGIEPRASERRPSRSRSFPEGVSVHGR